MDIGDSMRVSGCDHESLLARNESNHGVILSLEVVGIASHKGGNPDVGGYMNAGQVADATAQG